MGQAKKGFAIDKNKGGLIPGAESTYHHPTPPKTARVHFPYTLSFSHTTSRFLKKSQKKLYQKKFN
jgi:hypothetical protein